MSNYVKPNRLIRFRAEFIFFLLFFYFFLLKKREDYMVKYPLSLLIFMCMLLVASEGLERTNHLAMRCSFYLENRKYRFFGCSPLPMKGRE